jgi:hypothetical protein
MFPSYQKMMSIYYQAKGVTEAVRESIEEPRRLLPTTFFWRFLQRRVQ